MKTVFADTSYYVALLLKSDSRHDLAVHLTRLHRGEIVTTQWVLVELGNFFSPPTSRKAFAGFVRDLQRTTALQIIPASDSSFEAALDLFRSRTDQSWSFTDCASFNEMKLRGTEEAWTTDHHSSKRVLSRC